MPWTALAVAVAVMQASELSKPIVVRRPGIRLQQCKCCGANLREGLDACEYCRTEDIWLIPPRDEHIYPSTPPTPPRQPEPAPSPYRTSSMQERSRRRSSGYFSPTPAPSPWVTPVVSAPSYSSPAPAPSYEPPASCPAPSFSSGGGGDFSGGGSSGDW